jgi:hypothetical protein
LIYIDNVMRVCVYIYIYTEREREREGEGLAFCCFARYVLLTYNRKEITRLLVYHFYVNIVYYLNE